jgi:hypothetical protein
MRRKTTNEPKRFESRLCSCGGIISGAANRGQIGLLVRRLLLSRNRQAHVWLDCQRSTPHADAVFQHASISRATIVHTRVTTFPLQILGDKLIRPEIGIRRAAAHSVGGRFPRWFVLATLSRGCTACSVATSQDRPPRRNGQPPGPQTPLGVGAVLALASVSLITPKGRAEAWSSRAACASPWVWEVPIGSARRSLRGSRSARRASAWLRAE